MGMCRWMGSYFQDWIDYDGVAFSTEFPKELRECMGSPIVGFFEVRKICGKKKLLQKEL